jgi:hypothetical protein
LHIQVISYLLFLKESVEKLQAEAARINKYQALFKVTRVLVVHAQ